MMAFKGSGNIGDQMQAVALSRLLGNTTAFFRDQPGISPPAEGPGVAAGFMLGPTSEPPELLLFAGIYWLSHPENDKWLRRSPFPVGARDPETLKGLERAGIPTELTGCVTLTLPRYTGPRSGEISVDCDGPGRKITHRISPKSSFADEWEGCLLRLDAYRKAGIVHTSRIHAALPCLAMGTPVRYVGPMDGRTSIIRAVGLKHGEVMLPDVSAFREGYLHFLRRHLGVELKDGDPVFPNVHEDA